MRIPWYPVAVEIFPTGRRPAAGVYCLRKKEAGLTNKTLARPFYLGIGLSLVSVVAIPFRVDTARSPIIHLFLTYSCNPSCSPGAGAFPERLPAGW